MNTIIELWAVKPLVQKEREKAVQINLYTQYFINFQIKFLVKIIFVNIFCKIILWHFEIFILWHLFLFFFYFVTFIFCKIILWHLLFENYF